MVFVRRHPAFVGFLAILALIASFASLGFFRRTASDPILEVFSDSLTTYLYADITPAQLIRPQIGQRATNLDGSARAASALPMSFEGNPFERTHGGASAGEVNLATGCYDLFDVDLSLPSPGFSWPVVSRTYNARQVGPGGLYRNSDGPQGANWFQGSAPELVFFDHASDPEKDVLYLFVGADRFIEFRRVDLAEGTSDTFRATNGAAGCVEFAEGAEDEPDTYTYTDQNSFTFVFFAFDADASPAEGQLWKVIDPDDRVAFVGDATTGSTAISTGFQGNGYPIKVYDTADRRYTYTYTTLDGVKRLTQVKAETKTSGTWASPSGVATVGQVDYAYYTSESYGDPGDLKQVTNTIPQTDSGINVVKKTYYRYYEGNFDAESNPGYVHGLLLVVGEEGCRGFDYTDVTFDEDFLAASTASLEPYAEAYFEYDTSHRISTAWFHGSCGCSGAGEGTFSYAYETNGSYSNNAGYDTTWCSRTVVEKPDGSYVTQVFDEAFQPLTTIVTDGDPAEDDPAPSKWVTHVVRNSGGCITDLHTPANVTGYTHSSGAVTTSSSVGHVRTYVRDASGVDKNYVTDQKWKKGTSGTAYLDGTWTYDVSNSLTVGDDAVVRPFVASSREYTTPETSGTSGSNLWSYATTVHSGTLAVEQVTTTEPAVSTGTNGSNASVTTSKHISDDGNHVFEKSGTGRITYKNYLNGQLRNVVQDADTTKDGVGETFENVTIPTGFDSAGTPLHFSTIYSYDPQGRLDIVTHNGGRVEKNYYSRLKDHRVVTLHAPKFVAGTPTIYGPVSYTVTNHAGKTEVSATVALSTSTAALTAYVDETDGDPITAMDLGSVAHMTVSLFDEAGSHVETTRLYHVIPGSGAGSDGTNYDATTYSYDDSGRLVRTKAPHGTINRTVYDAIGRVSEHWIGTNDADEGGTDDIVKTVSMSYDGGSDGGNSLVTTRTAFVQDSSTDQRVTTFAYDTKGSILLQTNPLAPHALMKVDNVGRTIATGLFTSTASIDVTADDPTSETANRCALAQTFFDERGDVWKTQRHKIDVSDGSDDDNLQSLTWRDADRRMIKIDGAQLAKTTYDGLGRVTDSYVLASDDDSVYADAEEVSGDVVVEQRGSVFDAATGLVLLSTSIERFHDDVGGGETTGALDTQADSDRLLVTAANVEGRIQITGLWYDSLDRPVDVAHIGTYNAANYDRGGASAPARSDTALRTTTTYNDDGTVQKSEDPKSIVTKWEYDAVGRKTKEIRNYNAGVNSGNPSGTDDNVTTTWTYTDGLMTTLTADVPVGETDQVTTYTYGTTKGASAGDSKIATGHLLWKTAYPDSSGDSDTLKFAYNAQSEVIYKRDQAGNVFDTTRDALGRQNQHCWTTASGGFDTAVRRIATTYASTGQTQLVTQYDNATVGSGSVVDEVKYVYDSWGNLSDFQYDRDSAVGANPDNKYAVSYAYSKATGGRNTVRKTSMTMPSTTVINYEYSSSTSHDDNLSRVTKVKIASTEVAKYDYNGAGAVIGTTYDEPDVFSTVFSGTPGTYDGIDRFGRVTNSRWTKDLSTDRKFYDSLITWDRNGNPTSFEDNVHTGFDVKYDLDDLDRVVRADEGTLSGGSITSRTRDQQWTLTHTGNWGREKLDLDGDGNFNDAGEHDDTRTHNAVNELTARDTDSNASDNYTLTYDAVGNLTDDGEAYEYVYDGFGRLRYIKDTGDQSVIAEYKYNGLGFRTAAHEDTDDDDDVDGSDKWYYLMYDERWRHLSTFRETDSSPKEEFIAHQAGTDGRGGSSFVDAIICRRKDANNAWTSASDGVLEEVICFLQNCWLDTVVAIGSDGSQKETVRYSALGIPTALPRGDTDSDGDCDNVDRTAISGHTGPYDVRFDVNLDGQIDSSDTSSATDFALGQNALSGLGSRRGSRGRPVLSLAPTIYDLRHRVLMSELGHFSRRDPLGMTSDNNLYRYCANQVAVGNDPYGLIGSDTSYAIGVDNTVSPADLPLVQQFVDGLVKVMNEYLESCCAMHPSTCNAAGGPATATATFSESATVSLPPDTCAGTEDFYYLPTMETPASNLKPNIGSVTGSGIKVLITNAVIVKEFMPIPGPNDTFGYPDFRVTKKSAGVTYTGTGIAISMKSLKEKGPFTGQHFEAIIKKYPQYFATLAHETAHYNGYEPPPTGPSGGPSGSDDPYHYPYNGFLMSDGMGKMEPYDGWGWPPSHPPYPPPPPPIQVPPPTGGIPVGGGGGSMPAVDQGMCEKLAQGSG